jgi:nucleoside 2-deoxyribosyltransferase
VTTVAELKPFAFVLMPFGAEFSDIYKLGIQDVCKALGVVAERVDEQTFSETILERIYRQIEAADFIIADMSGRNPNVFYEVGYAHAKGKLCILLTQDASDIPFDLKHHRHLVYGSSISAFKDRLKTEVEWLRGQVEKNRKETITVRLKHSFGMLHKNDWSDAAEVDITIDVHNRTDRRSPEIEAMYLHTGGGWTFSQGPEVCPSTQSEKHRHFVKPPVVRMSPGAWAQVKLKGKKTLWTKWGGTERKEEYKLTGQTAFEIVTSEGSLREILNLDLSLDEIPF